MTKARQRNFRWRAFYFSGFAAPCRLKMELYNSYSVVTELFINFDRLVGALSVPETAMIPDCPV
jgi:hypothetical protein